MALLDGCKNVNVTICSENLLKINIAKVRNIPSASWDKESKLPDLGRSRGADMNFRGSQSQHRIWLPVIKLAVPDMWVLQATTAILVMAPPVIRALISIIGAAGVTKVMPIEVAQD